MPITQSRMIALINAARDYQQAFDRLQAEIAKATQRATNGSDPQRELYDLSTIANPIAILWDYGASREAIAVEYSHFKTTRARNEAASKAQARKRAAKGITPQRQQKEGFLTEGYKDALQHKPPLEAPTTHQQIRVIAQVEAEDEGADISALDMEGLEADSGSSGLENESEEDKLIRTMGYDPAKIKTSAGE